jgi:hypothetical protein
VNEVTGMAELGVETTRFAGLAQRYRQLIDQRETVPVADLLSRVQQLLASLYAAAVSLPDVEGSDDPPRFQMTNDEWQHLFNSLQAILGPRSHYREVFDPYDPNECEPVTASLADDLADVYRDLREGLHLWDAGHRHDAVWAWRDGFQSHWGEHATGALRAIHALAYRHDLEPGLGDQDA